MEEARATILDLNVLLASILKKPKGPTAATLLTLYLQDEKIYIPCVQSSKIHEIDVLLVLLQTNGVRHRSSPLYKNH